MQSNWCTHDRSLCLPSGRNRMPRGGVSPPLARRWKPDLSDEFNGTMLEGVTGGVLGATEKRLQSFTCYFRTVSSDLHATVALAGSKWLFKQEDPELWSLSGGTNGALELRTDAQPGIESAFPANLLLQRPTSACVQSFLHRFRTLQSSAISNIWCCLIVPVSSSYAPRRYQVLSNRDQACLATSCIRRRTAPQQSHHQS